jgi:hypothetical protein
MWTAAAEHDPALAMGIQVEMEHAGTIEWLIKQFNGNMTAEEMRAWFKTVAEKIARDHLKEMPDYYARLREMEARR